MPITDHFIHTVIIIPEGAPDEWGDATEEATPSQQAVLARVEWDRKVVTDVAGRERICVGIVFLGDDVTLIRPRDRIEFEGRRYEVIKAERHETHVYWGGDPDREHWEVYIA